MAGLWPARPLWGAILAPAFKRGLAKIGSSEPIFDWGSSLFSIFTPPGPAGHPPHKCGGKALSIHVNNNLSYKQEIFYARCINKSKLRFRHH